MTDEKSKWVIDKDHYGLYWATLIIKNQNIMAIFDSSKAGLLELISDVQKGAARAKIVDETREKK